ADPAAVASSALRPARPVPAGGDLTDLAALLRRLPNRQIVVLGEPGAGKSVLALTITLHLLAELNATQHEAAADPAHTGDRPAGPVPVLLSLSGWHPHTEHLAAWAGRQLVADYPALANAVHFGPDAALRLVDSGRVLLVLDGLDEMPPALHASALDEAVAGGKPLLLTCRTQEYEAAVRSPRRWWWNSGQSRCLRP